MQECNLEINNPKDMHLVPLIGTNVVDVVDGGIGPISVLPLHEEDVDK